MMASLVHRHMRLRESSVYAQSTDGIFHGRRCQNGRRMLKKAAALTRPAPARQDAPFRGQGRSELSFLRGGWDDSNCARPTRAF